MKIVIKTSENSDGNESNTVVCDGKTIVRIHPLCDCPEDAIIGRDLIDGFQIADFMKLAHEAGKRGEDFEISEEKEERD